MCSCSGQNPYETKGPKQTHCYGGRLPQIPTEMKRAHQKDRVGFHLDFN